MLSKVGLDPETFALIHGDMQGAYVSSPIGNNAFPAMMRRKFIGETTAKVVRLANIYRIPSSVRPKLAKDIDSWSGQVDGSNGMMLEFIRRSALPQPNE
jgi:hypothetical protein